jgi:hypothetical protein
VKKIYQLDGLVWFIIIIIYYFYQAYFDRTRNAYYYHNAVTQETTWTKPSLNLKFWTDFIRFCSTAGKKYFKKFIRNCTETSESVTTSSSKKTTP